MKKLFSVIRTLLAGLSFRTGVIVAAISLLCYAVSFGQLLLPLSVAAKGVLWTVFFGLAKAAQYSALAILGKAGVTRLRTLLKKS